MSDHSDKFINIRVDKDTICKYRIYCLLHDTTPQDEFRKMIRETIKNCENEDK